MRELKIAYGNSSRAKTWKNSTVLWEDLCERLRNTVRTSETMEEYLSMNKAERDRAKDRGGFVGGYLEKGRRRAEDVRQRSFITLDGDSVEPGFIERFCRECRNAAVLYTTHSHRPEQPRVRIILPLMEDISPDRFAAVSRYFAALWGIDQFDPCSYKINQMMYWPTTPRDGEYVCRVIDGPFLNAAEFLSDYPDWRDCAKLPLSGKEERQRERDGRMQEDPLAKDGIVGAFCRTYSIHEAIGKFLPDTYAPTVLPDRYDYIPGEGSCGVVTYEDRFAYSHHATDPAGGRRLNAFDLVRIHRFRDEDEKTSFLKMAAFAEEDPLVKETLEKEKLEQAREEFKENGKEWETPIPFGKYEIEPFPVDALPPDIGDLVRALAESTQTPVDMAGTAALTLIAVCIQGKYRIQAKADWQEPLCIFANIIASPSERKSAVLHAVTAPLDAYETRYNLEHSARVESSRMHRRILERRQKAVEDKAAKGKAEPGEVEEIAREISEYQEEKPLHLYVDDITTEKLVSVMASNRGRAALVSSEGGIFDTLAGIYTKNVNIDVMLKGYSGDTIRVDRIGRESESIMDPCLTILLMTQPKVISDVLGNATFRGRGLTARFLYCLPVSPVGSRKILTGAVPEEICRRYERKMINLLEDDYSASPEIITLSDEALRLFAAFGKELEPKLSREYAEIMGWAGKLLGNTLRIAGLLCRAGTWRPHELLTVTDPLVVSGECMENAVKLARYFLSHALAVFDVIPEAEMYRKADRILGWIRNEQLTEFNRRGAMRGCRSFKTAAEIQPVLDFLDDCGYISRKPEKYAGGGRPPLPEYIVNPAVLS